MVVRQSPEALAERYRVVRNIAETLALCTLYIATSAILINFNKYIMQADHFPYAIALTTVHMVVTLVCCLTLYAFSPKLFPSMGRAMRKTDQIMRYFPFISILFIVGVVCSNEAYIYCSVSFLQFMKEWNIALVFFFSCLAGSQTCDRVKLTVIIWIVISACMAVTGDMSFSHFGFVIQICSQLGETLKTVFQEWLLGGSDLKLDPLTYTVFMTPIVISVLMVGNFLTWNHNMTVAAMYWWPQLLANGFCAFLLNITIAMLIKRAGAMAFILSGLVKDVVIVSSATYLNNYSLVHQQLAGFTFAMMGISYWGLQKSFPNHALVSWLPRLLGAAPGTHDLDYIAADDDQVKREKEKLVRGVDTITSTFPPAKV